MQYVVSMLTSSSLYWMQATPKPIDIKQWQKRDRDVKIEKFIATAVKMPGDFDPANPTKQLIHWCVKSTLSQLVAITLN